VRIAILGADGRMGRALVRAVVAAGPEAKLTAATERAGSPALGQDAGVVAMGQPLGVAVAAAVNLIGAWTFAAPVSVPPLPEPEPTVIL